MASLPRKLLLPLLAALALVAIAVGVSACGYSSDCARASTRAQTVTLGELQYTVVFSRFLNPNDTEDSAYLVGQPPPTNGSTYFGVFFEVQNKSEDTQTLPTTLTITDADDQTYDALHSESLYAFPFGGEVESAGTDPGPRLDPPAGPDRGLGRPLRPADDGLGEPAADARDPRARRAGRSHTRPLEPGREHFRDGRAAPRLRRRRLRLRSAARRSPASACRPGRRRRTRRP